jgi:hypothetical protein
MGRGDAAGATVTRYDRAAVVIYFCVSVSLAFIDHRARREQFQRHPVNEYVPSVIAGNSGAPAKYRVLIPFLLDEVTERTKADPYTVFLLFELFFITASLGVTHCYLRWWYSPAASLGGTVALAAFLPLTFTNSWAHPDMFPELLFYTAGCLAVAARRDGLFGLILLVGMINRETTGFLAVLWVLHRLSQERNAATLLKAVAYAAISVGVYVGLRWARGFEHYSMVMLRENLQMLKPLPPGFDLYTRVAAYFWLPLLGGPAAFAIAAARRPAAPLFFRSALVVAMLHFVVVWCFAAIAETRVFVPVLPLLLPPALHFFVETHGDRR